MLRVDSRLFRGILRTGHIVLLEQRQHRQMTTLFDELRRFLQSVHSCGKRVFQVGDRAQMSSCLPIELRVRVRSRTFRRHCGGVGGRRRNNPPSRQFPTVHPPDC